MHTNIQYYIKQVYGNDTMYIADENFQDVHRCLTGTKTLTSHAMTAYKQLGFTFTQILPPTIC